MFTSGRLPQVMIAISAGEIVDSRSTGIVDPGTEFPIFHRKGVCRWVIIVVVGQTISESNEGSELTKSDGRDR